MSQHFASDNNAGMCPAALAALIEANGAGHAPGYGDDPWTAAARERIRALLETDCQVFFVFNGTAANALSLAQLCRPHHAVLCHAVSHIDTDEAGAPEFFSGGAKLLTADTPHAKLTPDAVERLATRFSGVHHVKPRIVSISQTSELGTVYTKDEIGALAAVARRHGLIVHMDGARFANAVAALDCRPADISWRAGVDILVFGGVKNGLGIGEAVVFFKDALAEEFDWRVKQAGQLSSKMRLIAAPWIGVLENDVWLDNARHANAMARRLAQQIAKLEGVRLMVPVDANAVFAEISPDIQAQLRQKGWRFYTFLGERGCRLMCAWDTQPETVDRFAADMAAAIGTQ
ncbi:MAG: threonine aldolase family protein [Hyphomicrobiaceae bacterium]